MGRIKKIILIFLLIIISVNTLILVGLNSGYLDNGFVIKAKPYVWIFAHGNYQITLDPPNSEHYHFLKLNGYDIPTDVYTEMLYLEGYNKIWLGSCNTGNSPYVRFDTNGHFTRWADYINRVDSAGEVIIIFTGFNFIRINR